MSMTTMALSIWYDNENDDKFTIACCIKLFDWQTSSHISHVFFTTTELRTCEKANTQLYLYTIYAGMYIESKKKMLATMTSDYPLLGYIEEERKTKINEIHWDHIAKGKTSQCIHKILMNK